MLISFAYAVQYTAQDRPLFE